MKLDFCHFSFRTSLIFLLLFTCVVTHAQSKNGITKYYLQGSFGPATHKAISGELGGQLIFNNKWVMSFSYQNIDAKPKNLPNDYEGDVFIFFPVDLTPTVQLNHFNFSGGRSFATGKKIWITAEAGITLGSGEQLTFTRTPPQNFIIGKSANYEYASEKKSLAGGIIKSDFNWAISPFFGLGAGVFANINSVQNSFGTEFKLMFGNLRPRTKKVRQTNSK